MSEDVAIGQRIEQLLARFENAHHQAVVADTSDRVSPRRLEAVWTTCSEAKAALRDAINELRLSEERLRASRNAVVEECARIVESHYSTGDHELGHLVSMIIRDLRALKSPSPPEDGNGEGGAT